MATFNVTTEQELIDAIISANNAGGDHTINLKGITYTFTSQYASGHALPDITTSVLIKGNNATLFCDGYFRAFRFYGDKLVLENLTIKGGDLVGPSSSGGIYVDRPESLIVDNCQFEDNSYSHGIHIYNRNGSFLSEVLIENTTFLNNNALGHLERGGGLLLEGNIKCTLRDCVFEDNQANNGGALATLTNFGSPDYFYLYFIGCQFLNNSATALGGAITTPDNNTNKTILMSGCVFDGNTANDGAVLFGNGEVLRIRQSTFVNNAITDTNTWSSILASYQISEVIDCVLKQNTGRLMGGASSTKMNYCLIQDNTGTAGEVLSGSGFDARFNDWATLDGPSGSGSGSGDAIGSGVLYLPFKGVANPPENEGDGDALCGSGIGYASSGSKATYAPISLRDGEKRLNEIDIQINTPLGALAFTRMYRQSQQDNLDFMGLGWTHNHKISLIESGGSPNKITVTIAGSTAIFYDDNADDTFEGVAGSATVIVKASSEYDLTASDESVYHFDSNGRLETRTLNNGEVWTYSYDGSGNLTEVSDGYGRSLKFAYYSGLGGGDAFKNGQLWRVGTHTSSNLASSPQTPYIELDYTDDGTGEALLSDVQDVRGESWTYRYYGSEMGETDTKWTNFLVEMFSPSVDSDGDGSADGLIQIQELSYSGTARDEITSIVQKRGDNLISMTMDFDPGNDVTTETTESLVQTYNFTNGVYLGAKDAENNEQSQPPLSNYRPAYQEDANGNRSGLKWRADGKVLESVIDAEYNETAFSYDSQDRLIASTDAEGRVTNYIYEGTRRQPSQIIVADEVAEDLAINGDMENNSDWSDVGTPSTSEQSQTEVSDGENSWYVDGASGEGIESNANIAFAANKTYLITARVYADTGTVKMGVDGDINWDVESSENDEWETLRAIHTPGSGFSAQLQFLAFGGAAQFYVDSVHVIELTGLERWQQFVYDDKARTLEDYLLDHETAVALQSTVREYGTSGNGNGLLTSITVKDLLDSGNDSSTQYDYDEQGRVIRSHKISMFGSCEYTHTVYDEAGNVLGTACGLVTDSPLPASVSDLLDLYDVNDSQMKHTRVTTHSYDEMGRRVATSSNAGASFARTNRTIYDALGRVVRSIQNYVVQGSSAPGDWVWTNGQWEDGSSNAISHGSELDENIISDSDYNGRGLVYRRRDVLGRVTLYGYNNADRLVKTVQNAATPTYDLSYATGDPDLSGYSASSNADEDIITETIYDPNGNVVKSIDARGSVTFTVYDALNRPVKVISNASRPSYDILSDLSLVNYGDTSADPDKDMLSLTEYDAVGRVIRSQRLLENRGDEEVWDTILYGYDTLGRQVASIQHASDPDYDIASDPDLSGYTLSTDPDVDMQTQTVYDVQGRVKETIDVNGRITRPVYDSLNRQVMTIANFVAQGTEPENWLWDTGDERWEDGSGTPISHGSNNDQNIISATVYDSDGRVESSRNVEGLRSYHAYDLAGRSALSVQHYVEQGMSDPVDWEWVSNQWEDGTSSAIARGTNYDQNLISQPSYDDEHRVYQTRDARGNLSRQVFDTAGRQVMSIANFVAQGTEPKNWVWDTGDERWEDGSGNPIAHGSNNDQNRISSTEYDLLGRSFRTRDAAGRETYTVYDAVGRVIHRVQNYVVQGSTLPDEWEWDASDKRYEDGSGNAIAHGSNNDQNIISETEYNQAGQVVSTRDAFGTQSSFSYDAAARRLQVTQASNTGLATASYTCFDKAGRTLRTISNYVPHYDDAQTLISPDAWDADGNWLFHPEAYVAREQNIVSEMLYDRASRRVTSINPMGNSSTTAYFKDGQVDSITDPEGMTTVYRYDNLRRRSLVVQSYVPQIDGSGNVAQPETWYWDSGVWKGIADTSSAVVTIAHGSDNDENIIVMLTYDIVGRMLAMCDPRGNLTTYTYDKLGRRTSLSNPLSKVWSTAYGESNGAQQTTMSYPGVNGGSSYDVVHDFDRFGRLLQIDYNDAANTPLVNFGYDLLGNRLNMTENNGTSDVRITAYAYDKLNRLTQVDFDSDADLTVEDTVAYEYDIRGLRTKLTMPGSLEIVYSYDDKGRLIALNDWDDQTSEFTYDGLNRHVATLRPNGMRSRYVLDGAGRLRELRHENNKRETLAAFRYTLDGHGNRVQAQELLLEPSASPTTDTIAHDDAEVVYTGTWTNTAGFHETSQWTARLALLFVGEIDVELTMGEGPDHSIVDIYIDGTLYESVDAYAASADSRTVNIAARGDAFHTLELRNRHAKNKQSSGYKVRFQSLSVDTALTQNLIDYSYDSLSRLIEADYNNGTTIYNYGYDVAGNMVNYDGVNRTYNAANQMVNDGTNTLTYDNNGNLRTVGSDTYTWDRANRLLSVGNHSYVYDGLGNRVQQNVSSVVTDYLNDLQPGLTKLLKQDDGTNVEQFVHAPRGIHAVDDGTDWNLYVQDGLGSVRALVDDSAVVQSSMSFDPYGNPMATYGAGFGYTGEQTDANGSVFLRARYYEPSMGTFIKRDSAETPNRYAYVSGNPVNMVDPRGLCPEHTLCDELQSLELTEAFEAVGCNSDRQCCGYDVTPWFVQELWNHGNYMQNYLAEYRRILSLPAPFGLQFPHNSAPVVTPEWYLDEISILYGFKTYAAAIPYKWMNFAVDTSNSDCPTGEQCTRSVTLCGTCIDRSELGNIMFGYSGGKLGINRDLLWAAARFIGALRGEAERAAARIGVHLSKQSIGTVDEFCDEAMSVMRSNRPRWEMLNTGQSPDVSVCEPCTELLPSNYPHTIPLLTNPAAGTSVWADNSILSNTEANSSDPFYTSQINGIQYVSPELCADLNIPDTQCGASILGQ